MTGVPGSLFHYYCHPHKIALEPDPNIGNQSLSPYQVFCLNHDQSSIQLSRRLSGHPGGQWQGREIHVLPALDLISDPSRNSWHVLPRLLELSLLCFSDGPCHETDSEDPPPLASSHMVWRTCCLVVRSALSLVWPNSCRPWPQKNQHIQPQGRS